jgi:peptidyl-prolyl cis-trans isomerase C
MAMCRRKLERDAMKKVRVGSIGRHLAVAGMAAMMLSGCGSKTPNGQVIATVNGDDITRRDLAAELQANKAPATIDIKAVQPVVTEQIVNRKLLVEEAKRQGLDKTPDYLAAEQRSQELILAQQLVSKWASQITQPSDADLQGFIDSNPQMFANRKVFALDQLRTSASGIDPKQLEPLKTMDQVIAFLQSKSHQFKRGHASLDSVTIPKAAFDQLTALPPGMPFINIANGELIASVITGAEDNPVTGPDQNALAKAAMQQQAIGKSVTDQVKSLKAAAKIDYQPGYAPAAK